jgi:hypothetical protein
MSVPVKKRPNALKHAGYSATSILPGESAAEFEKLHKGLIREFSPNGALESEIIATLAHLLSRRRNLPTFRVAERAQQRVNHIRDAIVSELDLSGPKSDVPNDFDKILAEKRCAAETKARRELGEAYRLVEMGEEATIDCLMKDLAVQERLDATIDKCLKRLLLVRGLKSMSFGQSSAPPKCLPDS